MTELAEFTEANGDKFPVTIFEALDQLKDMQNFMKEVDIKHAARVAELETEIEFLKVELAAMEALAQSEYDNGCLAGSMM